MPEILAQFVKSKRLVPASVDAFIGLQVGRALEDEEHLRDYLLAGERFSAASVLAAYRVFCDCRSLKYPGPNFYTLIRGLNYPEGLPLNSQLVALCVGPRSLALAVFVATRLEYTQVRELPSDGHKAETSALGFLGSVLDRFPDACFTIECRRSRGMATRQALLVERIRSAIRTAAVPLWEIEPVSLFRAFAEPSCRSRTQYREIVAGIWPNLSEQRAKRALLDAAGLGLFVQTKRLLAQSEQVAERL